MGFCLGRYELWPRCRGVLPTVRDVASSSGSTYDGTNRLSLLGSACDGTGNTPSKSEPKWLVVFLNFSAIVRALIYECLRATELVLLLLF